MTGAGGFLAKIHDCDLFQLALIIKVEVNHVSHSWNIGKIKFQFPCWKRDRGVIVPFAQLAVLKTTVLKASEISSSMGLLLSKIRFKKISLSSF
jgi:hypothetical protein